MMLSLACEMRGSGVKSKAPRANFSRSRAVSSVGSAEMDTRGASAKKFDVSAFLYLRGSKSGE